MEQDSETNMNQNNKNNIESLTHNDCLDFIWKALNKASTKGVFTIDESYSIKLIFNKLVQLSEIS